jgi:hypothetical protein
MPALREEVMQVKITLKYLYGEIVRFRKMMGEKTFWLSSSNETRSLAVQGLSLSYFRLEGNADENRQGEIAYHATMDEFSMRENLILFGRIR